MIIAYATQGFTGADMGSMGAQIIREAINEEIIKKKIHEESGGADNTFQPQGLTWDIIQEILGRVRQIGLCVCVCGFFVFPRKLFIILFCFYDRRNHH
jgi:hypothetical protein